MEYYTKFSNRTIPHTQSVPWLMQEYEARTGSPFADPDRAIRRLAQDGKLVKRGKGRYEYSPEYIANPKLEDFTRSQKEAIFRRDNYRCVICGKGRREGVEIHADHIKPKDVGGQATVTNGQTLCASHNFRKKNLKQTETGKKLFIRLYELAKSEQDHETERFCRRVLEVFEEFDVNGHIEWKR